MASSLFRPGRVVQGGGSFYIWKTGDRVKAGDARADRFTAILAGLEGSLPRPIADPEAPSVFAFAQASWPKRSGSSRRAWSA